jgi:uncharacterized protein YgbK (DUF1537 family)
MTSAVPPNGAVARSTIRDVRLAQGRRAAVFDDDPTGSQSVRDVSVVTSIDDPDWAGGLSAPGSTCFFLTNTRSLSETDAVALNERAAARVFGLEQSLGTPIDIVSRSDSTMRGHVVAEVRAIDAVRRRMTGRGYDGILLAPAYLEAGRFTSGDVHRAIVHGEAVPIGSTEFAKDATFGYTSSNLRELISEKSAGSIAAADVLSVGLDDIRTGGPERVAEILVSARGGQFIVVNATEYSDLDTVVLGLQQAQGAGKSYLHRTGPSFVRALIGGEPWSALGPSDVWPEGRPAGRGLVVVGSHVAQTGGQLGVLRERFEMHEIELSAAEVVSGSRDAHLASVAEQTRNALRRSDVLLYTSRELVRGVDSEGSLDIARTVSRALTDVVRAALPADPSWVVAKGGITSHDVATRGLGIRRATVLGQLLPGMVSVLRPQLARDDVLGLRYVVFAGNVGDTAALADVVELLARAGASGGG